MAIPVGLKTALNEIRETSIDNGTLYHRYVPVIMDDTDIGSFASPILSNPNVMNEFMNVLVQRIVYTQVETKLFKNPLRVLEGDRIPLGAVGQEIAVNPAKANRFDVDDFAGLLAKYEADVKVQYTKINSDLQYKVTITRAKLKDAFVSWSTLENFIDGLTQSLYNGAYIDQYNLTKGLVSSAYKSNQIITEVVSAVNSEANAKAFITKAREIFLNMQTPTTKYNAWAKVGGYGRELLTWTNPEDVVFLIRNDLASYIDVNVLAAAFNIDRATLLGNIIYVNDFDVYDDGEKVFDGSNIVGFMGDKSFFRIKEQETTMDEFYNCNNRTWQYMLNVVRMYAYSLFANGVCFCTAAPSVPATELAFNETSPSVAAGSKITLSITTKPFQANPTITFTSGTEAKATVTKIDDKHVEVTGEEAGTSVITATDGTHSATVTVTVTSADA